MQSTEQTTITASGNVLVWCQQVRERMAEDAATAEPDSGIPFAVCEGPTPAEYKRIITEGMAA